MTQFKVTVRPEDAEPYTTTVEAADRWKAETRAMAEYLVTDKPGWVNGCFVEYDVEALA